MTDVRPRIYRGKEAVRDALAGARIAGLDLGDLLPVFEANNLAPVPQGSGYLLRCPVHGDRGASLWVTGEDDGRLRWTCFGACNTRNGGWREFASGMHRWLDDPAPLPEPDGGTWRGGGSSTGGGGSPDMSGWAYRWEFHNYTGPDGTLLATKIRIRFDEREHGKIIRWAVPLEPMGPLEWSTVGKDALGALRGVGRHGLKLGLDGLDERDLPLYRWPEIEALPSGSQVYLVESESSADRAWKARLPATCGPGGATARPPADLSVLDGKDVVLVPDEDAAGEQWLRIWRKALPLARVGRIPERIGGWRVGADGRPEKTRTGVDLRDLLDDPMGRIDDLVIEEPEPQQEGAGGAGGAGDYGGAEGDVFDASPLLGAVRDAARNRLLSPWSVLGVVLARLCAEIPPHVTLPPIIGGHASLNLFVGLTDDSSGGKSGSLAVGGALLPGTATQGGPSSGPGLLQAFVDWDPRRKRNVLKDDPRVLLVADEVDGLTEVQKSSGNTLGPTLRTMWSGGAVATTNAERQRNRSLPPHTYRLALVAGVQPEKSGPILNDGGSGTPQRWTWLPCSDPGMPEAAPAWPGPLGWKQPVWPPLDALCLSPLPVDEAVSAFVVEQHRMRVRGTGDPLDGHSVLNRLKIAALLGILHGEPEVTPQWWDVAGAVMTVSDEQRARCAEGLASAARAGHRRQGAALAVQAEGRDEAMAVRTEKAAAAVWRAVVAGDGGGHANMKHPAGAGCTSRCVAFALRHFRGIDRAAVLARGVDNGWLEVDGEHIRPGDERPEPWE